MKRYLSVIVALMVTLFAFSSFAFSPPPKPDNGWYVRDDAGKLTSDQVSQLNQKIENLNKTTKNEYAVLIVSSLDGDDIADAAQDTFRAWGVGKKDLNNGVMFIVSVGDHKMRIQTGKGAEGDLPDLLCKDILDHEAKPHFKRGEFYEGVNAVLDAMAAHMESRATGNNTATSNTPASPFTETPSSSKSGGCSIVGTVVGGFAVLAFVGLLLVFFVVRFFVRKARQTAAFIKHVAEEVHEPKVTLPQPGPLPQVFSAPVYTPPTPPTVPVIRRTVPVPTPAVHPAPVQFAPRPTSQTRDLGSSSGLGTAAVGAVAVAGVSALALAEAERERKRKREKEEREERERARRARARRRAGARGGGFGGGDSGGGGASSGW